MRKACVTSCLFEEGRRPDAAIPLSFIQSNVMAVLLLFVGLPQRINSLRNDAISYS